MSDEEIRKESGGQAAGNEAVTEIVYCPHLGIYHYRRADGSERMFDSLQLEKAIETYQKQNDERQAEFMALLTGFARQFPHQVVSFDAEGKMNLRELFARELPVEPADESAAGAEQSLPSAEGGDGGKK